VIGGKAVEKGLGHRGRAREHERRRGLPVHLRGGVLDRGEVSDLSGRGVGMDVVRTNIERIKGTIDVTSDAGKGTTLSITIPLTVAILPAMMVKVSGEIYAIPLSHILEIVRPAEARS
jgi:two-component system chemotaxis sensor kinase CheA